MNHRQHPSVSRNKKNGKISASSLGPVNNLEAHLQPDWWRRIFNSMYLKTDADVVEDKKITAFELDMFASILKMEADNVILDLAWGQGRHSLKLARRGYRNVYGLDRSHYLINKAKLVNQAEGLSVNFREGDARKLPFPTDMFDIVMILGNSYGYFESMDDDIQILREVFRVLKPGGKFLVDVADGAYLKEHFNPRSWEWLDKNHFVCRERSLASDNQRLISREVISNIKKGVIVDQFYAERLYTKEALQEILQTTGYSHIRFHDQYITDSEKNQDLGMMERRIITTADIIKEWSPIKNKAVEIKKVAVILGDPQKKDNIKPDAVFDDDDFNTINQLKMALSSLQNYKFSYYNNHDTLIYNLQKQIPNIDYVLNGCDEGFNNEATQELHVPALLEMLRIPYTGSNPQCLSYCYDKSLIRGIAKEMDIPVADGFYIKPEDNIFEMNIGFPVIVKPNYGDSSFGITQKSVAYNIEQLNDAILQVREKLGYDQPVLVEEFLTGMDLTVGIIGNAPESYRVLPIIEEDYSELPENLPKICGYEAKWMEGSPYFRSLRSIEAHLDPEIQRQIIASCMKLSERLKTRDYVRFDWRLDHSGQPKLLEVNPNPGWCWDGHLAKMAAIRGIEYSSLIQLILESAETRINSQAAIMKQRKMDYAPVKDELR